MLATIIYIGIPVLILFFLIAQYNKLKTTRNQIENAKSSLDALFIKRVDLIPNLVTVTKQYMNYESDLLNKLTQLRQQKATDIDYQKDGELSALMKQLMVQVENYPELKASEQFTNLQYSWNEVEEQISAGRRYLSASITQYNNAVQVFPSNVIAGMFNFKVHEWERATDEQRKALDAKNLF